ncbi:MAG TPA: hypothetical protein VEK57_26255 [Thermoanaerobaculia bacterium]|nr:hypothetical protein [Thermoanaerobaculia bacterium]
MRIIRSTAILLALLAVVVPSYAQQPAPSTINISGVTYTKWLWGNQRFDGSLYNFTNVPGEGWGDNGQGTEIELLVGAKPNRFLEVSGRIHSRFSQNFWTNFGGFGGTESGGCSDPQGGGDCGENDPRSNQYVKLRGMTVRVTPGYKYLDAVTFGSSDLGMFDAFTMGKIRYIDRDNLGVLLAQGTITPNLRYDGIRISLPRLWAGPGFNTGEFTSDDSAYGLQLRWTGPLVDVTGIGEFVNDVEVDAGDIIRDDGRELTNRYKNNVIGIKADIHPAGPYAFRAAVYHSSSDPNLALTSPNFGLNGYSPVIAADVSDTAWKLNADVTDPFGVGFSVNAEVFNIGSDYTSILAARRETDVLLTEGRDATWAYPGPANAAYGIFGGNPTRIGYSGWQGNMQQVATINVDNEFTDFDEPAAETAIGWKGFTITPRWQRDTLEISGEYSHIDYNTNWQAWGDESRGIENTIYPAAEIAGIGVGNPYRSAYAPFQEKTTDIALVRARYTLNVGKGVDLFGKIKMIKEEDLRLNDAAFLPYAAGDCPGGGVACANNQRFYSPGNSTSAIYGNPGVITVNGVTGYQWAPFDDVSDDDRDLDYKMIQVGAGYQLTDVIYGSLTLEHYDADLQDGNTAFQAYRLHEMASGEHEKQKAIIQLRFPIGGAEAGFNYEYTTGEFEPDFGSGFVTQFASTDTAANVGVPVGSPGFSGRFGGWNSLATREFDHQHLKAYFKVRF